MSIHKIVECKKELRQARAEVSRKKKALAKAYGILQNLTDQVARAENAQNIAQRRLDLAISLETAIRRENQNES